MNKKPFWEMSGSEKIKDLEETIERLDKAKYKVAVSLRFWNNHIQSLKRQLAELKNGR